MLLLQLPPKEIENALANGARGSLQAVDDTNLLTSTTSEVAE